MRYIAVDAGNSHLRVADVDVATLSVGTIRHCTYLDVQEIIHELAENELVVVVVCTVVAVAEQFFHTISAAPYIAALSFVRPLQCSSLTLSYTAETLGPDRLANALGAQALYPNQDCILIDTGTATTVDLLRADGTFLGGVIMPGLRLQAESLTEKTDRLPSVDLYNLSYHFPPQSTQAALESGLLLSIAGGIDRAVEEALAILENPVVLACGGGWPLVVSAVRSKALHEVGLTLLGTALSAHRQEVVSQ